MKVKAIHPECGGVAFFIDHFPVAGEPVMARGVTLLDGSQPKEHSPMRCGSCGATFSRIPIFEFVEEAE